MSIRSSPAGEGAYRQCTALMAVYYLSGVVKAVQAAAVNVSVPPLRLVVSRTRIVLSLLAVSMQSPP